VSVYKRKSGRWAVRIDIDNGVDGKRRQRSLGTFRLQKEAEKAERDAIGARDRGTDLSPRTVTIADLLERYLKDGSDRLETSTLARYRTLVDRLIVPHLGEKTLAKTKPAHVSEWMTDLRARGGHKGKPLSAKTCRHAFVLLSTAWRWALRMQLAATNPLAAVKAPTVPRSNANALSADEIDRIMGAASATRWGPFVTLAFATGMRRGELCALQWGDVDLERATVFVSRSLTETRDGGLLKSTKTGRARTAPLSRVAIEALRRQRVLQAQDRLAAGPAYLADPAAPIFTDGLGRRLQPLDATKSYGRIAKAAGITSLRLHDARHTAATYMLVGGADVRSVSNILGHASATTTLSTYAHLIADAQRDAVDRLGDRLQQGEGHEMGTADGRLTRKRL